MKVELTNKDVTTIMAALYAVAVDDKGRKSDYYDMYMETLTKLRDAYQAEWNKEEGK